MATLLASLLLGAGYEAYVVSGYATREVCLCDQQRVICPELIAEEEVVEEPPPKTPPKYRVRDPPHLHSRFLEQMAAREKKMEEDARRKEQEIEDSRIAELEKPPPDDLWGFRLHAWVLIRPSRDVEEPFFIEPATGFRHEIDYPCYHYVESVWNHINYWVNMQPKNPNFTCEGTDFTLDDVRLWEHLLAGEPAEWRKVADTDSSFDIELDEKQDHGEEVMAEKHLDMPASWVPKLSIQHAVYEKRYPGCSKTILYKKAKVEKFAPYLNKDGLMKRVTEYADYNHQEPLSVTEHYENRVDCLIKIERNLEEGSATDYFKRGREDACKEHQYLLNENSPEGSRKLWFYDVARLDGLEHLEVSPSCLEERFRCRYDRLHCRRVLFAAPRNASLSGPSRSILKVIEKFDRNPDVDADRDIAVREFPLHEQKILLKFHYGAGKVTAATREFIKPSRAERGSQLTFNPDLTSGYGALAGTFQALIKPLLRQLLQAGDQPLTQLELLLLFQEQLDAEEKTLYHIRQMEDELASFLRMRLLQTAVPRLQVSLFDEERNEQAKRGLKEKEQRQLELAAREVDAEADYLAPYISRLGSRLADTLTCAQALAMREDCLSDFKRQYVQRAQQMQHRFDTEKERLQELNRWYEKSQEKLTAEQEDHYFEECRKIAFLLRTLQIRLERHRDLAPQRFSALEACLRSDPRLAALY